MLYIDGKPFNLAELGRAEAEKYSASHTWVMNPADIKFDYARKRIAVVDIYLPTEYRSQFALRPKEVKQIHSVVYSTGMMPNPLNPNLTINKPPVIKMEGGVIRDCTDQDLNFFLTHAPWLKNGVAYDKNVKPLAMLYDMKAVVNRAKKEESILLAAMEYVTGMKADSIVSTARSILELKKVPKTYFTIDEHKLSNPGSDEYNQTLAIIHNGILKFAVENPEHFMEIVKDPRTHVYSVAELAINKEVVVFDNKQQTANSQGKWKAYVNGKEVVVCDVKITERPFDVLVNALSMKNNTELFYQIESELRAEVVK